MKPSSTASTTKDTTKDNPASTTTAQSRNVTTKTTKKTTGQSSAVPAVDSTAGTLLSSKVPAAAAKPAATVVRPNVRYSDKDLNFFKANIERSREEALEELRMLKERLDDLTSAESNEDSSIYSMHMAEQGSEAQEKEKTYAQIQRIQDYLRKLDEALQRIADKSYGICRMCGILIARERLLAVPITTLSASYKIHQTCPADGVDRIVAKGSSALKP